MKSLMLLNTKNFINRSGILSALFIVCFLQSENMLANAEEKWFKGSIILNSHAVVTGEVSVSLFHNLVLYRDADGQVDVLPAHKIEAACYYDSQRNINRRLVSLQEPELSLRQHLLFEIILSGDVSILRRPKSAVSHGSIDAGDFDYYVQQNDQFYPFSKFKSKILPGLLEDDNDSLTRFIRKENLNPYKSPEIIRIVEYHNELVKKQS